MEDREYYTTKQAAEILGLTEYTVRKKLRNKEIKAIEGSSAREGYKIDKEDLEDYARRMASKSSAVSIPSVLSNVYDGATSAIGKNAVNFCTGGAASAFFSKPLMYTGLAFAGIAALHKIYSFFENDDKNDSNTFSHEQYDLLKKRIKTEIESCNLLKQLKELDEDSKEKERALLEIELTIKKLETYLQDIEIRERLDK